jgi:hypothetical protein
MMATCYSGCELFSLFASMGIAVLSPLQLLLSFRCRRDTDTGAQPMITPTGASAVQSDIHS